MQLNHAQSQAKESCPDKAALPCAAQSHLLLPAGQAGKSRHACTAPAQLQPCTWCGFWKSCSLPAQKLTVKGSKTQSSSYVNRLPVRSEYSCTWSLSRSRTGDAAAAATSSGKRGLTLANTLHTVYRLQGKYIRCCRSLGHRRSNGMSC